MATWLVLSGQRQREPVLFLWKFNGDVVRLLADRTGLGRRVDDLYLAKEVLRGRKSCWSLFLRSVRFQRLQFECTLDAINMPSHKKSSSVSAKKPVEQIVDVASLGQDAGALRTRADICMYNLHRVNPMRRMIPPGVTCSVRCKA